MKTTVNRTSTYMEDLLTRQDNNGLPLLKDLSGRTISTRIAKCREMPPLVDRSCVQQYGTE